MTESRAAAAAAAQDRYDIDGRHAWQRLCLSLALATVGGIGLWSVVVALPSA